MPIQSENVGIAFGLVIGAGASTALGASVVFFPSLVKFANRKTLAGGLGLSAGVMTYVSFVEIFQKSVSAFIDDGKEENISYIYATLCFFGGVIGMVVSFLRSKVFRDILIGVGKRKGRKTRKLERIDVKRKTMFVTSCTNGIKISHHSFIFFLVDFVAWSNNNNNNNAIHWLINDVAIEFFSPFYFGIFSSLS